MAGGERWSDDGTDFVDVATAHERRAVATATVVTGSVQDGERVAGDAMVAVARDWATARDEGPAGRLRLEVLRRALAVAEGAGAAAEGAGAAGEADPRPAPDAEHEDRRVAATWAALRAMPAWRRAALALAWVEDRSENEVGGLLDLTDGQVRAELDRGVDTLLEVSGDPPRGGAVTDARALLDEVVDDLPETALAEGAWSRARERERTVRRRALVSAVGGLAAVGAVVAVAGRAADPPAQSPAPTPSLATGRLETTPVPGGRLYLVPPPGTEPALPRYPDAATLALPERIGPGVAGPMPLLSSAGSRASVRAVYLVRVGRGRYQPAVLMPRESPVPHLVPTAPLGPVQDRSGNTSVQVDPRAIHPDRHRIVFAQPREVVLLDVRTARARRFLIPDDTLESAGWAPDGRTVVAKGDRGGWAVDTETERVGRVAEPVHPGWSDIRVDGAVAFVESYAANGRVVGSRSMTGPSFQVHGTSVSNTEGWACRAAFFDDPSQLGGRPQGLVAVQGDLRPSPRILAGGASEPAPLASYRPLGFGPRDTVLLESRSGDPATGASAVRLLAWDVIGGRLYRVADVEPAAPESDVDEAFTGVWAL